MCVARYTFFMTPTNSRWLRQVQEPKCAMRGSELRVAALARKASSKALTKDWDLGCVASLTVIFSTLLSLAVYLAMMSRQ
jgi:hypothetical protein